MTRQSAAARLQGGARHSCCGAAQTGHQPNITRDQTLPTILLSKYQTNIILLSDNVVRRPEMCDQTIAGIPLCSCGCRLAYTVWLALPLILIFTSIHLSA